MLTRTSREQSCNELLTQGIIRVRDQESGNEGLSDMPTKLTGEFGGAQVILSVSRNSKIHSSVLLEIVAEISSSREGS